MELYLDSVDFKEIAAAADLGIITGLTTTPTFMHKAGIRDIDAAILELAKMVDILQIEALGEKAEEIEAEAYRQLDMGLDINKTVFKIPVSIEGVKACKKLRNKGMMVNIHLVYTLQQAYMAMAADATYICPLVGRLQDQGHDALALMEQVIEAVNYYGYDSKIMFSSVRHAEHVRNAINLGVHACTVPWGVMKKLTDNNLTQLGTDQFFEHTRLMTIKAGEIGAKNNPMISKSSTVLDAIMVMTKSGLGAVTVTDIGQRIAGIFTDGDLRRLLQSQGQDALNTPLSSLSFKEPLTVSADAVLYDAVELFKKYSVDNLIVSEAGQAVGMLDIQDLMRMNLIS